MTLTAEQMILTRLREIEERQQAIERKLDQAIGQAAQRYAHIDKFIDPAMNLENTLKQLIEASQRHAQAIGSLQTDVRNEHRTTRSAVATHLSSGDLARERAA